MFLITFYPIVHNSHILQTCGQAQTVANPSGIITVDKGLNGYFTLTITNTGGAPIRVRNWVLPIWATFTSDSVAVRDFLART